jgi:hypothetical protein
LDSVSVERSNSLGRSTELVSNNKIMAKTTKQKSTKQSPKEKKEITKETTKPTEIKETRETPKTYKLVVTVNEKVSETETDDLFSAIMSFKPDFIRTAVSIEVTKNGKTQQRYIYANRAKILFQNRITLEIFIRDITLTL